jgi:hypothetical protein
MIPINLKDLPRMSLVDMVATPKQRARRKYNNEPTEVGGKRFDSRAEARRWCDLRVLERAGAIADLQTQVRYVLVPAQVSPSGLKEREVAYLADFVYRDTATAETIVEDVKGASPEVWRIKRKLMLFVHGIEVREIKA